MFNQFSYFCTYVYIVSFSKFDLKCAEEKNSSNGNVCNKVPDEKVGADNASYKNATVNNPKSKYNLKHQE